MFAFAYHLVALRIQKLRERKPAAPRHLAICTSRLIDAVLSLPASTSPSFIAPDHELDGHLDVSCASIPPPLCSAFAPNNKSHTTKDNMMRPAALALFLALAGSGGSSRYSAHAFSSIPPPRQPPAPSNTPPPMDPAGQFDDTRGPTAGSPSGYGGGSGTGPGTDAAPPSASQEPSLSPPSSSRQQYSSSTARTTRTIGQPLIRRSTREEGFHSGTWWEEAAGAGDVRRGSAGNFQTYTDQQRRMARGEPFSVYDGGNVSRRTRSASGWADGRRPDRGTTTAGVRGQHNERSAAESAHNSWWDNPGSGQGTRGAGYGTQGNFKTYTDLQKEQQGGGGGRGNN